MQPACIWTQTGCIKQIWLPVVHFAKIICKASQLESYTIVTHLPCSVGLAVIQTDLADYFFFFLPWFTNMPSRSTDQQQAFWVLHFSAWCAVSLRSAVQTAPLWQRARCVASDTTSQTTHQTNTLKALSTLTLYHLICVIRPFIDIRAILQPAVSHHTADVHLHIYISLMQNNSVFLFAKRLQYFSR